ALGFVMLDGRWVPKEEAWRARGFVKFDGEWMRPAEARLRLDNDAAEQAGRDAAERARAAELENLKAEGQDQYAAGAAGKAEWRAERVAWSFSHACGGGAWGYGRTVWHGSPCFHGPSWHHR